jgi:uncharacterized protein
MPWLGLALAALVGVALGFFGGGGSILTVPLLVYGFGMDVRHAIPTSLLVVGVASLVGAAQHARQRNVDLRTALVFGSAGMTGAYSGGRAAALFDPALLLLLFAGMMVLTSLALWRGRRPTRSPSGRSSVRLVLQGAAVGLFTGLVGAGGGFLITPALVLWAGLPLPTAVGTSLLVITMQSIAGFLGHQSHAGAEWRVAGLVAAAAIAGVFPGAWLAPRVAPAKLRRAFAAFVMALAAVILARESAVWLATARSALPGTLPQAIFALVVLGIGVAAGRATQRAGGLPLSPSEEEYERGAGI